MTPEEALALQEERLALTAAIVEEMEAGDGLFPAAKRAVQTFYGATYEELAPTKKRIVERVLGRLTRASLN